VSGDVQIRNLIGVAIPAADGSAAAVVVTFVDWTNGRRLDSEELTPDAAEDLAERLIVEGADLAIGTLTSRLGPNRDRMARALRVAAAQARTLAYLEEAGR
jgi:hypothetical protein